VPEECQAYVKLRKVHTSLEYTRNVGSLARTLAASLVLAFAAVAYGVAPARADGDPASDILLISNVFLTYSVDVSPPAKTALQQAVAKANKSGFRIKVAVIADPADLGSVPSLFGKPQIYSKFLGTEISFQYTNRLLVVMPNGFGFWRKGKSIVREKKILTGVKVKQGGDGLAYSAVNAVKALSKPRPK
jgi:hypothetical protein